VDGELAAGEHTCTWRGAGGDGRPAGAGLYFARLEAGGQALTRRVARVR
jgi:hypothetical protein